MHTTFRAATAADLPALAVMFDRYRQFYDQAPGLELAKHFLGERMARRESVVLVAESGAGELQGFCQLYPSFCSVEAAPIYVLYDLFVDPEARRLGIGRQLLHAAHAQAQADGKVRMDLTTAHNNTRAQSLYESMGWVRDMVFRTYTLRIATT
jgi:ribosomal protein S18 acetylase RimI-like enzyme